MKYLILIIALSISVSSFAGGPGWGRGPGWGGRGGFGPGWGPRPGPTWVGPYYSPWLMGPYYGGYGYGMGYMPFIPYPPPVTETIIQIPVYQQPPIPCCR